MSIQIPMKLPESQLNQLNTLHKHAKEINHLCYSTITISK